MYLSCSAISQLPHLSAVARRTVIFLTLTMMAALMLSLSGCVTNNQTAPVSAATKAAANLQAWRLNGRVALSSAQQNGSASLRWQQKPSGFRVDIVAPLNAVSLRVTGNEAGVQMVQGDQTVSAASLEALEQKMSAQAVPFANMKYWIRGLPHPDRPVTAVKKSSAGNYQQFTQADWQIVFNQYKNVNGYVLPTKLTATNRADSRTKIVVLINQWQL